MVGKSISMVLIRPVSLLYVIVSLFFFLAITEMFHCARALRLDNRMVFGVVDARFYLFCFSFMISRDTR